MFWALIYKEVRLYRAVIIAAILIVVLGEIGVPSVGMYLMTHPSDTRAAQPLTKEAIGGLMIGGAALAWSVNCVLAAAFGGTSLAIERRENWSDLPAMLPISRNMMLAAKLLVGVAMYGIFWAIHACAFLIGLSLASFTATAHDRAAIWLFIAATPLISAALFGIAWTFSMFLRSPAIAVSIAIGVVGFALSIDRLYASQTQETTAAFLVRATIAASLAMVLLAGSWTYYVRRVAP